MTRSDMKPVFLRLTCSWLITLALLALAGSNDALTAKRRPADFVDVKHVIPQTQIDLRYVGEHNFVGRRIHGYRAPTCLLTEQAAAKLKTVVDQLLPMGLTLKVYDCYRPQTAVNDFAQWATERGQTTMRAEFYPTVAKDRLFREHYIAYRSGHSRGGTVDLTIVPSDSTIPVYDKTRKLVACTAPHSERFPDNSLDFGTGFDCFSELSHPDNQDIPAQSRANRLLLRALMMQAGFMPLPTEWWHFTLSPEPYPNTYFDFPLE